MIIMLLVEEEVSVACQEGQCRLKLPITLSALLEEASAVVGDLFRATTAAVECPLEVLVEEDVAGRLSKFIKTHERPETVHRYKVIILFSHRLYFYRTVDINFVDLLSYLHFFRLSKEGTSTNRVIRLA